MLQFLAHIEKDRGCSARTRNQRLAAIRAFARFVGSRDPAHVEWCGHIRAIAPKKSIPQPIGWLTRVEMEAMLAVPDRKTEQGRREYALLLFLYNTGARVQEVADLRVSDLDLTPPLRVRLHGKGDKWRMCPLWQDTAQHLRCLLDQRATRTPDAPVFASHHGRPLTRFGIYKLVRRHTRQLERATTQRRGISPHVFRHTVAVHLLEAGAEPNVIRGWLGHVSLDTTNRYAEINIRAKEAALRACEPPSVVSAALPAKPVWRTDETLLAWLNSL